MTFSAPDFKQIDRSILISVSDTGIFLKENLSSLDRSQGVTCWENPR